MEASATDHRQVMCGRRSVHLAGSTSVNEYDKQEQCVENYASLPIMLALLALLKCITSRGIRHDVKHILQNDGGSMLGNTKEGKRNVRNT